MPEEEYYGSKKYTKLPLTTLLDTNPWETVQVDMIGYWTVKFKLTNKGKTITRQSKALTMVDRATSWPEFGAVRKITSAHVSQLFDKEWLYCYPRPTIVIHDNGNKFNSLEFQELLQSFGITAKLMTVKKNKQIP